MKHSVLKNSNQNLNPAQQELMKWHCPWSHVNLDSVRMILAKPYQQKGSLSREEKNAKWLYYWCTACLFAITQKKSIESSITSDLVEVEGALTKKDPQPGDKVSCDQYMSTTKGRLIHIRGKGSSMKQVCFGTIFVDHATNYIFNNHKINLTAATTVESKHKCESKFDEFGIQIKKIC